MRVGALCAGYGGLELGLHLAGIDTDLVWGMEDVNTRSWFSNTERWYMFTS